MRGPPAICEICPINPCRPASRITRNPTTTPGNANGKLSTDTSTARPGNRLRSRNRAGIPPSTKVSTVTAADSATVSPKLSQCRRSANAAA